LEEIMDNTAKRLPEKREASPGSPERAAFYATTPIFYANAKPHLGHAYATILVDVVARYHRLKGDDTYFLTGTDEHGEKVAKAATAAGQTPQQYVDLVAAQFKTTWDQMGIKYDEFMRTTEVRHKKVVQEILQRVYDNGDIFYGEYSGLYCVGAERFVTEKELIDGKCPDSDQPPEYRSEANYFFRMEKYRPWLRETIERDPNLIRPERYRNEVLSILREPIGDLSISRPISRVPWGIPLPWDEEHVCYVWFDALINYYSALESKQLESRYWPGVNHFIGKDILKPHGVFWPTMLKAANLPLYKHLNVHGHWVVDGRKMSKSLGNAVEPLSLQQKYGSDAFRYYLVRDITFGLDANFTELSLAERINADLANDLGNLLNRTLGMVGLYRKNKVPAASSCKPIDNQLIEHFNRLPAAVAQAFDGIKYDRAVEAILNGVRAANKYISDTEPWKLAKDEESAGRLDTVLNTAVEALRCASILLDPIMPTKMHELRKQLGIHQEPFTLDSAGEWNLVPPGTVTSPGDPLFPRIDLEALEAQLNVPEAPPLEHKAAISIDEFGKLELRVATVLSAEPHPDADKLLVLKVKVGPEERTVVAGLRQQYQPEQLTGKRIVIVANLKPAKLRGVNSQGMILAAEDDEGNLAVATFDRDVTDGSVVR
jgi:methionyl-tRNA synthetase